MAKLLGNNYRLWIESATAGTYSQVLGQQSLSYDRQAATIDTSDKNNSPYGTSAPGNFAVSISLEGMPDLPDANGYARLEARFKAQAETRFQIRKGGNAGASPADVVFEGLCNILQLNTAMGQNEVVRYSVNIAAAAAPTTDLLA